MTTWRAVSERPHGRGTAHCAASIEEALDGELRRLVFVPWTAGSSTGRGMW